MFGKSADDDAKYEDREKVVHRLKAFVGVSGKFRSDRIEGSFKTEFAKWRNK